MIIEGNLKVRFHLAKGDNFMKWQIRDDKGNVVYVDPENYRLVMEYCQLVNQKSTAKKIKNGANKSVCAWIKCSKVQVYNDVGTGAKETILSFNPKVKPNWVFGGENADGSKFRHIYSGNRKLYGYGFLARSL